MRTGTTALRVALLTALGLAACGGESRSVHGSGDDDTTTPTQQPQNACPCRNGVSDASGNLETCDHGLTHRQAANECVSALPRSTRIFDAGGSCTSDADCADQPHGYCEVELGP